VKNRTGELLTMSVADDVDLVALTEKAELLAEATGRDKSDVLADLLDDGELNFSSGADAVIEKGILDKANEQAEKAKTLLITLMPVIAILLGGGGAEMLGITDFTGMNGDDDDEYYYEPPYEPIWGCMAVDADNYDPYATDDDGSCVWPIYGCMNPAASNYDESATVEDGSCEPEHEDIKGCTDSNADNYDPEAEEDDGSCEYAPSVEDCTVGIHNHYRGHEANDAEQDAIMVSFRVVPDDCDDFDIDLSIELFQNGHAPNYTHQTNVMGGIESDVSHVFDEIPVGNWIPKVKAGVQGEPKENVNFWAIDIEEQEPACEENPFFYASEIVWNVENNTTEMKVRLDADLVCSEETEYIEVDIIIKNSTNQTAFAQTFGFNITGTELDWRSITWSGAAANETYSIHLDIWWESDAGWRRTDDVIHSDESTP